jgi:hypothetical protein
MNMIIKSTVLSVIAFLGSLAVAEAQSADQGSGFSSTVGSGVDSAAKIQTSNPLGWNYVHATNCSVFTDGTTTWYTLYPQEGGWWQTTNVGFQTAILSACQTGNWIAFYVTNTTSGNWNQLYTFTFK